LEKFDYLVFSHQSLVEPLLYEWDKIKAADTISAPRFIRANPCPSVVKKIGILNHGWARIHTDKNGRLQTHRQLVPKSHLPQNLATPVAISRCRDPAITANVARRHSAG
jgi:hypothetical protein